MEDSSFCLDPHEHYSLTEIKSNEFCLEDSLDNDPLLKQLENKEVIPGSFIANMLIRQGIITQEGIGEEIVNAYDLSETLGIPYNVILRINHEGKSLVKPYVFEGVEDLGVALKDIHHVAKRKMGKESELTKLVLEYRESGNEKTFNLIYELARLPIEKAAAYISKKSGVPIEELESEGHQLLFTRLIPNYSIDSGANFDTYLKTGVRGAMLDELRSRDPLSRPQRDLVNKIQKEISIYRNRNFGEMPSIEKIAQLTQEDEESVIEGIELGEAKHISSSRDYGNGKLEENLNSGIDRPEDILNIKEELERVYYLTNNFLPESQANVFQLYYFEDISLKEIGAIRGVTESRACQILANAKESLERLMSSSRENPSKKKKIRL